MTHRVRFALVTAALAGLLALPVSVTPRPAAAQLPTPVLDNGAMGDGSGAASFPRLSYPILIGIALLGAGIGLMSVTVIRRWDRNHYPDNEMEPKPRDPQPHI